MSLKGKTVTSQMAQRGKKLLAHWEQGWLPAAQVKGDENTAHKVVF